MMETVLLTVLLKVWKTVWEGGGLGQVESVEIPTCRGRVSHLGHLNWQTCWLTSRRWWALCFSTWSTLSLSTLKASLFTSKGHQPCGSPAFICSGNRLETKEAIHRSLLFILTKSLSPIGFLTWQLPFFQNPQSIEIAHNNMKPGKIFMNKGNVDGTQINRSPYSYLQNPLAERLRWGR